MNESNVVELKAPAEDALGELLKEGARQLLAQAIEAEVAELLIQYADQTVNGKRAVVRNGYLPERSIQTGLGEVPVKVPKVRDRSGGGIKFNSKLVPPYLKRTKRVFDLVKDFGTSESPKSTRSSTTHWCPGRPGHPAFRHNIASSLRLHTGLPYDWTPRSDAPLGSPLAPSARRVSRVASRLPGTTRLRFALHGGQRKNVEEFIPWLYLKGISTGEMQPALEALLGEGATGLSAATVSRLKKCWEADYRQWRQRDLSRRRYVYVWADGVYSNVRMDDRLCLLVIVGSDDTGRKEVQAVVDGYRESEASWLEVIEQLESQGLTIPPKLAIGDGALGFWKALAKKWPQTAQQRCWVHKTANVLNKVPKSVQPKVKAALHEIWMAETRESAYKAFDRCVRRFEAKYPKAMECLVKDKESLLAFYDFPAAHWQHIRTTNPIESVFATVRLRTMKTKNCGNRMTTLAMAWKLMETAQNKWRRLRGYKLLAEMLEGVKFKDGERVEDHSQGTAETAVHQI